jgi:hypothetical protein
MKMKKGLHNLHLLLIPETKQSNKKKKKLNIENSCQLGFRKKLFGKSFLLVSVSIFVGKILYAHL